MVSGGGVQKADLSEGHGHGRWKRDPHPAAHQSEGDQQRQQVRPGIPPRAEQETRLLDLADHRVVEIRGSRREGGEGEDEDAQMDPVGPPRHRPLRHVARPGRQPAADQPEDLAHRRNPAGRLITISAACRMRSASWATARAPSSVIRK
jgi:hypothetical protein